MAHLRDYQDLLWSFLSQKMIGMQLVLSLVCNLGLWLLLGRHITGLGELVPLHYTIYFGIDLLGPWYHIFALPFTGAMILLGNLWLGLYFFNKERIASHLLISSSLVMQVLLLIAGIAITSITR